MENILKFAFNNLLDRDLGDPFVSTKLLKNIIRSIGLNKFNQYLSNKYKICLDGIIFDNIVELNNIIVSYLSGGENLTINYKININKNNYPVSKYKSDREMYEHIFLKKPKENYFTRHEEENSFNRKYDYVNVDWGNTLDSYNHLMVEEYEGKGLSMCELGSFVIDPELNELMPECDIDRVVGLSMDNISMKCRFCNSDIDSYDYYILAKCTGIVCKKCFLTVKKSTTNDYKHQMLRENFMFNVGEIKINKDSVTIYEPIGDSNTLVSVVYNKSKNNITYDFGLEN